MGSKKQCKNAFSFFLQDYIQSQREQGRYISSKIGAEECSSQWKDLSEEEKQVYKIMAETEKLRIKNEKQKGTMLPHTICKIQKKHQSLQDKMKNTDEEIKLAIDNLDQNKLPIYLFYLVHCNYYCKTNDGIYIPGEIALCEFNLKDGIKKTYHQLINPGRIPLGFAYETQQNIKDIHGLPYPPYPEGNSNYNLILKEILNFLETGRMQENCYPPLYCLPSNVSAAENILHNLSEIKESPFSVYPIHKLLFSLKNKCIENISTNQNHKGFPVQSTALLEIEKDVFCYLQGISCDFHINIEDKYENCSLSIVQRFVYVICDHCCQHLDIGIIAGKHGRSNCDSNRQETLLEIEKDFKSKQVAQCLKKEKSEISGLCSYFGGNNVPEWTKITSSSLLDDEY